MQTLVTDGNMFMLLLAVVMLLIGFAIGWLLYAVPLSTAKEQLRTMHIQSAADQRLFEEKSRLHEQSLSQMHDSFAALSQHALRENNAQFLQLAQESLLRLHNNAQHDLDNKQRSFEALVEPLHKALDATREQVNDIEKDRKESFGRVSEQMHSVIREQVQLRDQTQQLVTALKRPEVRGQWGEVTLKRLVELAGMVNRCDFEEQRHEARNGKVIRPDLVVTMPDKRMLVVDAKTPLDAYLQAVQTSDSSVREEQMNRHVRIIRDHIQQLAAKSYWEQFDDSPDFVILFLPGEQFLGAALDLDNSLLEDAMRKQVILATPSTLIALLRSVAYGWKQVALSENAKHIQSIGEDVYRRVSVLTDHFSKLGKSLNQATEHYNKTLGSIERSVLPGMRRFAELGINESRKMTEPDILENHAREPLVEKDS